MTSLRQRALAGERLIGVLLRMPGEELVEMSAVADFDFILIDCEHGPADVVPLRQHIMAATVHDVPVIVRVGENEPGLILRALDQGAQGVVGPHLDTRADAVNLVTQTHYPPAGARGFATYSRAGRFGSVDAAAHGQWFRDNTLVMGMIESPVGVGNAADIASTPGLDGIMIGPSDLAATTGPGDTPVAEATRQVHQILQSAKVLRMDIVGTTEAASAAFDDGANLVVYNLAHALMAQLRTLASVTD